MSELITFHAEERARKGKGGARECRRAGQIPAVIYGSDQPPASVAIGAAELQKELRRPGFLTHVYAIELAGRSERVLAREVQVDPVSDKPIHVDFMRVAATTRVHVDVAIVFVNEAGAPGLRSGGVLNVVQHTVELVCTPDAIPERLEVDLTGLDIGDVVHADQLKLPQGVEFAAGQRVSTIATIAPPTTIKADAAEAAETAAPAEGSAPGSS